MCKVVNVYFVNRKSFWDEGVDRQIGSCNLHMAIKQFNKSCLICNMQNKRMSCDQCPIRKAFEVNTEIFYDETNPAIYKMAVKELMEC